MKMSNATVLLLFLVLVISNQVYADNNAFPITDMNLFPYQVTINSSGFSGSPEVCGGSILNSRWILSSDVCLKYDKNGGVAHFHRLYSDNSLESFSITFDNNSIYTDPFDKRLALVKLPMELKISKYIQPIELGKFDEVKMNQSMVVMTGFMGSESNILKYGKYKLLSHSECKQESNYYDETLICAKGWIDRDRSSEFKFTGSGLVIDWPESPKLIGVGCCITVQNGKWTPLFTNLAKYYYWIQSTIN